jgi:hypothetical protein
LSGRLVSFRTYLDEHPVLTAVVVGLGLRVVAATTCDGWFAADDYAYVLEPAWRWLANPEAAFPSHYRSPLLAWIVAGSFRLAQALGFDSPTGGLHLAYLLLGLWSLLAVPGVYRLARARHGDAGARQAIWLMAAFAVVPSISTRALIEVACIPPLVWGLAWTEGASGARRPAGQAFLGGLGLGLGALVRFQLALVFPVVLTWLVLEATWRRAGWRTVAGFVGGGFVAVLVQGSMDLSLGRAFLGTPLAYLTFNLGHASDFGTSPWHTYILQLLVLTVPPVTLWLARPIWAACVRHPVVSCTLVVFVAAHSVIDHKEDRFLFPMLPLFFVLVGAALAELRKGARLERAAWVLFWGVNLVALGPAVTVDPQRTLTGPLLAIREQGGAPQVAVVGFRDVPALYLGHGPTWTAYRDVVGLLDGVESGRERPAFIVSRPPIDSAVTSRLEAAGLACAEPTEFSGDFVDRLLLAVNPTHNRRRLPTTLRGCRGSPAL